MSANTDSLHIILETECPREYATEAARTVKTRAALVLTTLGNNDAITAKRKACFFRNATLQNVEQFGGWLRSFPMGLPNEGLPE